MSSYLVGLHARKAIESCAYYHLGGQIVTLYGVAVGTIISPFWELRVQDIRTGVRTDGTVKVAKLIPATRAEAEAYKRGK